jgi:hypothetical protein
VHAQIDTRVSNIIQIKRYLTIFHLSYYDLVLHACFIFLLTDSSLIFVSIELIFSDYEMIVTVQGPRPKNILDLIHETIITLIKDSFQGVDYDFYIPCPDCVDKEVRDCCLTPHELFFSYMYIMTRTSYIR